TPIISEQAERSGQDHPGSGVADPRASRLLRFVQFPSFVRDWHRIGLDDEALRVLERTLHESPDGAPVLNTPAACGSCVSRRPARGGARVARTASASLIFPRTEPLPSSRPSARTSKATCPLPRAGRSPRH